jgi:hypothetical protein
MQKKHNPQAILDGFYDILSTLQGIEYMACGTINAASCETPAYHFGKLAGLIAQRQAKLCSELTNYLEDQEWTQKPQAPLT